MNEVINIGDSVRAVVPHSDDRLETFNGIVTDVGKGLVELLLSDHRVKVVAEKYVHPLVEETPSVAFMDMRVMRAKLMREGLSREEVLNLINYTAYVQDLLTRK